MTIPCYKFEENRLNSKDLLITLQKKIKVKYGLHNKSLKDIFLGVFLHDIKIG